MDNSQPQTTSTDASTVDSEHRHLASVYGQALLAAADKKQMREQALEELDQLVGEVLAKDLMFAEFLRSGIVSREARAAMLRKVLADRMSEVAVDFLLVLNQHDRLDLLQSIVVLCREMDDQQRGRIAVEVTSAIALNEQMTTRVREQLHQALSKEPVLVARVDPKLIGGLIVRVGDTVYDGSVATRLGQLQEQIRKRSVHEIQSRRDHLGDPAGN